MQRLPVKFIAGRLCLDFVNTAGGRTAAGAVVRDHLGSYTDLLAWSVLAKSISRRDAYGLNRLAGEAGARAERILTRAKRFREALYRVFAGKGRDIPTLRAEIAAARARQELIYRRGRYEWALPARLVTLDSLMWPIALSAADLLTSEEAARVRACAGADCRWLFLDSSRNGRRRWCDMQDCGNRAKVRRFRAKASAH